MSAVLILSRWVLSCF